MTDTNLILHHYPLSPYSEKVRAMLGYTGLEWLSVTTREMPPRPLLEPLTGGYRRIPVAQVGADIFCDTRTISNEIALRADKPELALENQSEAINQFVTHTEQDIFFACILSAGSMKLGRKVMKNFSWMDLFRFFRDRISMSNNASVKMPGFRQAKPLIHAFLEKQEELIELDFLFGNTPCIADFAAYHCLWFIRDAGEKNLLEDYPRVNGWMDRIKAFGHGDASPLSAEDALEIAARSEPAAIADTDRQHDLTGQAVSISPTDYARIASQGVLVASTEHKWVIRREEAQLGYTHVHFPKHGFSLTKA